MKPAATVFVLLLLLLASPVTFPAASLPDAMFVAETAVDDEGSETRNRALSALLADVLVRVSGDAAIVSRPAAREVVAAAPSLVQRYRYLAVDAGDGTQRLLRAWFDADAVQRRMRESGLPVWTRRPRVLLWLAGERDGRRELLNLELLPEARDAVLLRSRELGMPLQLPLMDLEDQARLTPADLWAGYRQGIALASARYPHDVVLGGRVREHRDGKVSVDWTLLESETSSDFATRADGLPAGLADGVAQAQRQLASRYAPVAASVPADGTRVLVRGVDDLAAYARVLTAMSGLDPSVGRALRVAHGDNLVFELTPPVTADALRAALDGSGALIVEPPPIGPDMPPPRADGSLPERPFALPLADYHYRLAD